MDLVDLKRDRENDQLIFLSAFSKLQKDHSSIIFSSFLSPEIQPIPQKSYKN